MTSPQATDAEQARSAAAAELARLGGEAHAQAHQVLDADPELTRQLRTFFVQMGDLFISTSRTLGGEVGGDEHPS